mmetsp:Transcript_4159/g.11925  ORF Transcript_4159/g.11925 Transcript_4159/m.11925 type:complete len:496 (+) Transcript_4159:2550-4037(+)
MSLFDRIPRKRRSVFRNALAREYGLCGRNKFERGVSRYFHVKQMLQDPDIASPHRKSISSLSMDSTGRFLLAGCADATVTVYDFSKWGQSKSIGRQEDSGSGGHHYAPVAKSVKVPAVPDILQLPAGHSSSITYTQWYPTDAGVFLSGSSDGTILLWDTHKMKPVLRVHPFREDSASWISAHLRTGGDHSLIAAGSWFESEIKLVDIRSGASSHQLVGHSGGISALKWSSNNPHIVASGSRDSTVRLWDIRKSGSRACVTVLDRERVVMPGCMNSSWLPPSSSRSTRVGYASDYSHLRREPTASRRSTSVDGSSKRRRREAPGTAPNNYDHVQHQVARSHRSGHVSGLSFFSSGHYLCSVSGLDGELLVWDLRSGCMLPSKFVVPGNLSAGSPRQRRTPILAEGSGYTDSCNQSSTIWIGRKGVVHGFPTEGGTPKQTLKGHLTNVTSMEAMEPGGKLLSGSSDGMILAWGQPRDALAGGGAAKDTVAPDDTDDW